LKTTTIVLKVCAIFVPTIMISALPNAIKSNPTYMYD